MKNKKYKVEIPEGFKLLRQSETKNETSSGEVIDVKITLFKPINRELRKTWEGYLMSHPDYDPIRDHLKYEEAFKALGKLITLRDHYNDGWEPDWTTSEGYRSIIFNCDIAILAGSSKSSNVLTFKKQDLAEQFLSNFAQLIETAKPLL